MSQTRIEQLINEIYEFIEECKPTPLSQSKIIVQKDQLLDLVDELKRRTPDEIKRYQKIIANRDSIIAQAEERAKEIEAEARERAQQMVDETEVKQSAYKQANDMIQKAVAESEKLKADSEAAAEQLRTGVLNYASDILAEVENLLSTSYRETRDNSERLINTLQNKLDTITENRKEILEQLDADMNGDADYEDEDYNFPEDTFTKDIN